MDVSRVSGATPETLAAASAAQQEAVWDIKNNQPIYTDYGKENSGGVGVLEGQNAGAGGGLNGRGISALSGGAEEGTGAGQEAQKIALKHPRMITSVAKRGAVPAYNWPCHSDLFSNRSALKSFRNTRG
jgi:hypothetical protein